MGTGAGQRALPVPQDPVERDGKPPPISRAGACAPPWPDTLWGLSPTSSPGLQLPAEGCLGSGPGEQMAAPRPAVGPAVTPPPDKRPALQASGSARSALGLPTAFTEDSAFIHCMLFFSLFVSAF